MSDCPRICPRIWHHAKFLALDQKYSASGSRQTSFYETESVSLAHHFDSNKHNLSKWLISKLMLWHTYMNTDNLIICGIRVNARLHYRSFSLLFSSYMTIIIASLVCCFCLDWFAYPIYWPCIQSSPNVPDSDLPCHHPICRCQTVSPNTPVNRQSDDRM